MAAEINEINTYFGRCRCCLNYGYLKNMWEEHYWEGKKEIYVEMLVQCFALSWEPSEESMKHDQICEACITRLRDADSFKKTVLESQVELLSQIDEEPEPHIKVEQIDVTFEYEDLESEDTADTKMYGDDDDEPDYEVSLEDEYADDVEEMEYEEVEYLEDEDNKNNIVQQQVSQAQRRRKGSAGSKGEQKWTRKSPKYRQYTDEDLQLCLDEIRNGRLTRMEASVKYGIPSKTIAGKLKDDPKEPPTRVRLPRRQKGGAPPMGPTKWPKKLPKSERYKTYRQYTEEDFRACLEDVRSEKLTTKEAADKYNIPLKTVANKLREEAREKEKQDGKQANSERRFQYIQEIKIILTLTNATPFKCKANTYFCLYCSTEGPQFEDAEDLRAHVRSNHEAERTQKIEYALRPYWSNEILRLDVHDLECVECSVQIDDWNSFFDHLKDVHSIELVQAYTRVIPYDLTKDLKCVLCKQELAYYMHLDSHMNAHYNNHVCAECGDTFLTEARLKQHIRTHDIGRFACSICGKVFAMFQYKTKHEETVHSKVERYKCRYCDEKFTGEFLRHEHIVKYHSEKVKITECEFCGKKFTWRPYYLKHKKMRHDMEAKKYECDVCGKKYVMHFQLREHMIRHAGEKIYGCKICDKKYVSPGSLKHHLNRHVKLGQAIVIYNNDGVREVVGMNSIVSFIEDPILENVEQGVPDETE